MNNSRQGRANVSPADKPLSKDDLISDFQSAMFRALDALWRVHSRGDGEDFNAAALGYIHDQLSRACRDLQKGMRITMELAAILSDKPATADMLDLAEEADLLIDKHAVKPAEGGGS